MQKTQIKTMTELSEHLKNDEFIFMKSANRKMSVKFFKTKNWTEANLQKHIDLQNLFFLETFAERIERLSIEKINTIEAKVETGAFVVDSEGSIHGIESYDRLKTAKLYQKIFAFFSKKYKKRFLDLLPMKVSNI